MKIINNYEIIYRKNDENGRVIIDIALDHYIEFFHEWDNSSFKKRDIHAELAAFLDLCSEDIPLRKQLEIVFTLPSNHIDLKKEEQIRTSFRNYYFSLQRLENRKTKRFIRISLISLCISLVLLTAYGLLIDYKQINLIFRVFMESLLIGGWVFAWEAVHSLFIDIIEPFHRRREIKRFQEADIKFLYVDIETEAK